MVSLLALTGVFQPPIIKGGYNAVPMLSDPPSSSLFAFIMFPGVYDDVYEIASKAKFANIFLVPVSLNVEYVSDIHRLVTDLTPLKKTVKVIFPGRYQIPVNNLNENCILRGGTRECTITFPEGFITFDYKPACECNCCKQTPLFPFQTQCDTCYINSDEQIFHDIYVYYKEKGYLFTSTVVNKQRIKNLLKEGKVDYVYVPYSHGYVNQDSFLSLAYDSTMQVYMKNLIAYGFRNYEEFLECYKHYRFSTPMTYRSLFTEDNVIAYNPNRSPVIGNTRFCPSVLFGDINIDYPDIEAGNELEEENVYMLPLPNKDKLPPITNPTSQYKTIALKPGANEIIRQGVTDENNPFVLHFTAIQRVTHYTVDNGQMSVLTSFDVPVSWEDITVGYYTPEMKHVPINIEGNSIMTISDKIIVTFFDEHKMIPTDDETLIIGKDTSVYVTYDTDTTEVTVDLNGDGDYTSIMDAINAIADNGVITLHEGYYNEEIVIDKPIEIRGDGIVTLGAPITINQVDGCKLFMDEYMVLLHDLDFVDNAMIRVNPIINSDTNIIFGMLDCTMLLSIDEEHASKWPNKKVMPIYIGEGNARLTIKGCTFDNCGEYSYNLFEIYANLGQSIWIDNIFKDNCCTHNQISLYGIQNNPIWKIDENEANTSIIIERNVCEKSANFIRLGFKGKPEGEVIIRNNTYNSTDDNPDYAGILIVQPFKKLTESFKDVTIELNDNKHTDNYQLGYLYAGSNDTQWTEYNKPTVIIDGEKYDLTGTLSIHPGEEAIEPPTEDSDENLTVTDDGEIDIV